MSGVAVPGDLDELDRLRRRNAELEAELVLLRTAQAQTHAASQPAEELKALYDTAPVGLCMLDRTMRFVRVNHRMAEINGSSVEEHIGRTVAEVVPDLLEPARAAFDKIIHTRQPILNYEISGETAAQPGVQRYWRESWVPIFDANGDVVGVNIVAEETTERRRIEMDRQRLASIVENASDFIGISDTGLNAIYVNEAGRRLVGLDSLDEACRTRVLDYFIPDNLQRIEAEVFPAVMQQGRWTGELTFRHFKTGSLIPVIYDVFRLDDPETGKPTNFATVTRDITERYAVERRLRESEARLRATVQAAPFPMMLHAEDGEVLELSQKWTELSGYAREEIETHLDWVRLAYPDRVGEVLRLIADEFASEGEIAAGEFVIRAKDGGTRIWDFHNFRVGHLPDGRRLQISAATDVTERRRFEEALASSERRLNAVLSNTRMAVFMMDERHHCVYMNAAAEALTGYRLEDAHGRPLHDVIHHTHPDGREFPIGECPINRAFPDDLPVTGEGMFVHKDGHFYPVGFTASPIRDAAARTIGTILEVHDISQAKEDEARVQMLIGELNHRVKNTLATVQSIVLQALRGQNVPAQVSEAIVSRLLALSRSHELLTREAWSSAGLKDVALEALEPFGRADRLEIEGENIRLRPKVALALGMAFHELATNALKHGAFSNERGTVRLSWSIEGENRLRLTWQERDGPPVRPPTRKGFGSRLIERGLAYELDGTVRLDYQPKGVSCTIDMPAPKVGGGNA